VQKAVFVRPARDLGNLRLDDQVGVVANALIAQVQALHNRRQIKIECLHSIQVRQIGFDFRWPSGLVKLLQQREAVTPTLFGADAELFFQQIVEMGTLIFGKAVVDDFAECALVTIESCDDQVSQHIVAGDRKTAAYLRVSTFDQDLEKNKSDILRFANHHDLGKLNFVEEIASRRKPWRERLISQVLEELQDGDAILVAELSRLGRSMLECMEIMALATRKGIRVYSVKEAGN
jgi:Resolvase, N terminal domain